jgi:hypothetical protein
MIDDLSPGAPVGLAISRDRLWDSNISLPMSEKPLKPVTEETDFLSRARGDGTTEDESGDGMVAPPKEVLERLS